MQATPRKKIMFLGIVALLATQVVHAQFPATLLRRGDSLFAKQDYPAATRVYEIAASHRDVHPGLFLKLAFLKQRQRQDAQALYYLNRYYERNPSVAVLRKMSDLAETHGWTGYELNDLNLLVLLYKQYGTYLIALLLALAGYVFGVLFIKRIRHQYILSRHKLIFLFYLSGVGILINLPENYAVAIVRSPQALLRTDASAGAPIADAVGRGNRLSVLGNNDIWLRVLWNNQLSYVRQTDVWLVR
jgi:hypothetical protein